MAASDPSPLGDPTEHAGDRSDDGHTVKDPEGVGGGEGGGSASGIDGRAGDARTRKDTCPESERLANASRAQG